ncbi:MAG: FAD-dependent oxidoreductase, partial [Acidobacteria bacterium]|nr:FAD-dependent oxidoreductase [Acidobacteriota bacterium]
MPSTRRAFVSTLLGAPLAVARAHELKADVAIIGGGTGGVAAALAALRNGRTVILTEETDWLGGQLTSQAVPPDEHPWIESFGSTAAYRAYRDAVRDYYRRNYPLTPEARRRPNFNPGDGTVSRLTHEPRVSVAVIEELLAAYLGSGRLTVLTREVPTAADVQGDRVRAVSLKNLDSGHTRTLQAAYFIDATEQGDLLPLTGTEYVTGAESRTETSEPHAPSTAQPGNIQSFTVCFAMDHLPGEDHTIDKPAEYAFWRDYFPQLTPPWPAKLLSWGMTDPIRLTTRPVVFDPDAAPGKTMNLWLYRRIANQTNFAPGTYRSGITLVNWPQNDFWLGNLHQVTPAEAARN